MQAIIRCICFCPPFTICQYKD